MRKCYKSLFKVIMAIFVVLLANMVCVLPVKATEKSGEISWSIDGKTLTISGNGAMQDYEYIQM